MKGAAVKSDGSSQKNKTGSWKSEKPVVDQQKCIKCKICEMYCPESCISVTSKWEVDLDYCKGCGICCNVCPVKCLKMVKVESE